MKTIEQALSDAARNEARVDRWLLRTLRLVREYASVLDGAPHPSRDYEALASMVRDVAKELRTVCADANFYGRRIDPRTRRRQKGKR